VCFFLSKSTGTVYFGVLMADLMVEILNIQRNYCELEYSRFLVPNNFAIITVLHYAGKWRRKTVRNAYFCFVYERRQKITR